MKNRLREILLHFLETDRASLLAEVKYLRAMLKATPQKPSAPYVVLGEQGDGVEYDGTPNPSAWV
jgi:hypothetical protein